MIMRGLVRGTYSLAQSGEVKMKPPQSANEGSSFCGVCYWIQ